MRADSRTQLVSYLVGLGCFNLGVDGKRGGKMIPGRARLLQLPQHVCERRVDASLLITPAEVHHEGQRFLERLHSIAGDKPLAVLKPNPPPPISDCSTVAVLELGVVVIWRPPGSVVVVGVPGIAVWLEPDITPLPQVKFCAANVPDQSIPFAVVGFWFISSRRASIKTCRVAVSRRSTN